MLSTTINVHKVTRVTVKAESETKTSDYSYATRSIVIETDEATIEVTLFSKQKQQDDDTPYIDFAI